MNISELRSPCLSVRMSYIYLKGLNESFTMLRSGSRGHQKFYRVIANYLLSIKIEIWFGKMWIQICVPIDISTFEILFVYEKKCIVYYIRVPTFAILMHMIYPPRGDAYTLCGLRSQWIIIRPTPPPPPRTNLIVNIEQALVKLGKWNLVL